MTLIEIQPNYSNRNLEVEHAVITWQDGSTTEMKANRYEAVKADVCRSIAIHAVVTTPGTGERETVVLDGPVWFSGEHCEPIIVLTEAFAAESSVENLSRMLYEAYRRDNMESRDLEDLEQQMRNEAEILIGSPAIARDRIIGQALLALEAAPGIPDDETLTYRTRNFVVTIRRRTEAD